MDISTSNLKGLVDKHFHSFLVKESYVIRSLSPTDLLTSNRFDIAFKLFYLDTINKEEGIAKELYKGHIEAFSLGKYAEPGNVEKNSIEKYYQEFAKISKDIGVRGFSADESLIPISKNGSILNGSHRIASAIVANLPVKAITLPTNSDNYNYDFFFKRGMSERHLDIAASKFIEYADNIYLAIIWPSAGLEDSVIPKFVSNIVYKKNVKLNHKGAHNLISQIYYGEPWIGSEKNNFSGALDKLLECFRTYDAVKVIAFQADTIEEVLEVKKNVRELCKIGKHSIHITDNKCESVRVSRALFNDNSVHMLNYADPNRYQHVHEDIERVKDFADLNGLDYCDLIIDTSMVLALYGLRQAQDIDLLCNTRKIKHTPSGISLHDEELRYYKVGKTELIYNPDYFFYFKGLKFASFNCVFDMKKCRNENKDVYDCNMMEALIERRRLKKAKAASLQSLLFMQARLRAKCVLLLRYAGLYKLIKTLYLKLGDRDG